MASNYQIYRQGLIDRYWSYQSEFFPNAEDYFERPFADDGRPPVFHKHKALHNVISNTEDSPAEIKQLANILPTGERHRWFRSMSSSQALAQSVIGNLAIHEKLDVLKQLDDDAGWPLLGNMEIETKNFQMEYRVNYLGELRQTSLDGFFFRGISGCYRMQIYGTKSRALFSSWFTQV